MKKITKSNYFKAYITNVNGFLLSKNRIKKQPNYYYKNKIMLQEEGTKYLQTLIQSGKPFAAARFGSTELGCINNFLKVKLFMQKSFKNQVKYGMENYSGFFPADDKNLFKFGELMQTLYPEVDLLAVFNIFMEDFVVQTFCENAKLLHLRSIDPIATHWTKVLKGKKVLVIHPFAELIEEQYKKRELLFTDNEILPEFQLSVFPAVQTIAGVKDERFNSWFEALDYMISEIRNFDFDIALIGAGAYGLPLAVKIKCDLKKQAVHIGGATQLLFGIKGKRWDDRPDYNNIYNEHWVRPGEKFIPSGANRVENGCYW
ncbi:hypothetical protein HHO41_07720 [Bacillus sp. DNRA2]|uniref:GT-D fold domain-containing protein n=1 Tax=Bacillus sp. DNRA2 TaxID=2723053 RepID=UPI00145E5D02|nr:hypothetical protein [Bacillus sp. DNRA2]NMD70176.1 hypothetical protein [Bacillus sp. DNRA2]